MSALLLALLVFWCSQKTATGAAPKGQQRFLRPPRGSDPPTLSKVTLLNLEETEQGDKGQDKPGAEGLRRILSLE